MACEIYAVAHIGHLKLFVGEAHKMSQLWRPMLTKLEQGSYPHSELQAVWDKEAGKRRFTFHTRQEIIASQDIIGIPLVSS